MKIDCCVNRTNDRTKTVCLTLDCLPAVSKLYNFNTLFLFFFYLTLTYNK